MHSFKDLRSLAPLYLAVFVAVLGFSLVAPFFPGYAMNLGANFTMLGFIVSIYGAVQLITQIPIGRLSDSWGRKKLLLLGLATFTFLPPLYVYADNAYTLLFIRALGGVGASLVWPTAMALIIALLLVNHHLTRVQLDAMWTYVGHKGEKATIPRNLIEVHSGGVLL